MTIFTSFTSNWAAHLETTRDAILAARERRRAAADAKLAARAYKHQVAQREEIAVQEMLYKVQRAIDDEAAGVIALKERVTIIDGVSVVSWE